MTTLEQAVRDRLGNRFGWRRCWITLAQDGTWSFHWMRAWGEGWHPNQRAATIDEVFRRILTVENGDTNANLAFRSKSRAWFRTQEARLLAIGFRCAL